MPVFVLLPECVCAEGNPDASVVKTATVPTVTAGGTASYTITVTAGGDANSTNVKLTDVLPTGFNWTLGGTDAAACSPGPPGPIAGNTTLTCTFGTMASGTSKTITLSTQTSTSRCPAGVTIMNTATLTADGDSNTSNNSSGPITITVKCPDVSVVKTTTTPTIIAGATATYNVVVTANGTSNSTNVVLTDTLPAFLSWTVGGTDKASCSPASPVAGGTTLTCNFGTMAPQATKSITLTATTSAANCPAINNTATVSSDADTNSTNNTSGPVKITVNCASDAKVVKTTTTPTVTAGGQASYSIAVTANGPANSTNVVLTDALPSGLNWTVGGTDSASCSPASPVAGGATLTCNFGTMAPQATKSITLTATTSAGNCPAINNTATVSSDGDTNSSNNTSGPVKITVNCSADVKVVKTTTTPIITAGDQASYGITVTANGPASSTHVVLTDVLPAGLTWTVGGTDKANCLPASPVAGGTTLTCNFGTMAPLATKSITLTATTSAGNCPEINNTATVSSDTDTTASNNTSGPVKITVNCPCPDTTFKFTGNTSGSGTAGNIRTFTMNGVSVHASAFSRTNSSGAWATAYLGLFGPGLGVTDGSESGNDPTHKVDNQGSRKNYVLFEFSVPVVIDQVFLDSIGADSDMSVWIGTKTNPFTNHITLSDAVLTSLGAREDNNATGSVSSRWANINSAGISGNVIVIAASTSDTTPDDEFKISKLDIKCK